MDKSPNKTKKATIVVVIAAIAIAAIVPAFAWFYFQRSIQTATKINAPNALVIGAGNARDIKELELSNIDVSDPERCKDVVFCVYSENNFSYNLQLSHTTNIGFKFTIIPASQTASDGDTSTEYLDETFYFNPSSPVSGGYLNQQDSSDPARAETSGTYHDKTYAGLNEIGKTYDNVQPYAEPLYWKTDTPLEFPDSADASGKYINYYVLRISWDEGVVNNKETDMIYLMAEAADSGA